MIILRKIIPQKNIRVAENLTGVMNGINKIFNTTSNYTSGRISILYNGQDLHSSDDFIESGDDEITLLYISPHVDDVMRVTYEVSS